MMGQEMLMIQDSHGSVRSIRREMIREGEVETCGGAFSLVVFVDMTLRLLQVVFLLSGGDSRGR